MPRDECQARCAADESCTAVEVNGCNADGACRGNCHLFYGDQTADLHNGQITHAHAFLTNLVMVMIMHMHMRVVCHSFELSCFFDVCLELEKLRCTQ